MRMFKWKTIPGWFLAFMGAGWSFLRAWATTEFIFKKLWPGQDMMPALTAIAPSTWFPIALVLIGLAWIWWFSRPPGKFEDDSFVSLTKAVETLIGAGKQKQITKGIGYYIEMQNDPDRYYEPFAKLIAQYVDVYGKRPSISFDEWEKISEDMILMGDFRKLGSELYFNKEILFNNLAIRKIGFDNAIQEILSSDIPFPWISHEVK